MILRLVFLLGALIPLSQSAANPAEADETEAMRLLIGARTVFAHNCYECHSKDKMKGGLRLDSKDDVFFGGDSGEVVAAGDPEGSELLRRVLLPRDHDDTMPPKGEALPDADIEALRRWISAGAPWPDNAGEIDLFPEAPLEPRKPEVPEAPGLGNPIDRFVDAYFEEQGLEWPEPVGDRLYIRRAYLDVIGLLPTYEEVEAFVADVRPGKRERLVESLLNRKHDYAQHWMSFWNDALRNDYAGTGYIDGGRKQISDWLYSALYENKPYDDFVAELIDPSPGSEGFIKGIKWRGTVNSSQTPEMQAAQNVSQVFLGINLKCASCHDSFISNWKLEDAYAFAAVFSEEPLEINRCDKPTGKIADTAFLFSELGTVDPEADMPQRLEQLADAIVGPGNGRLARTWVNRLWAGFFGRGLVEPVDSMDNKPWNQDLLDWLASDFAESGYDNKRLIRMILTSRAYQLPSVTAESANALESEDFVFRGPVRRRLSAEQFTDALSQIVGPLYGNVAFNPYGQAGDRASANWIWSPEEDFSKSPGGATFRFRRGVDLSDTGAPVKRAEIIMTADNDFTLWVDGAKVGGNGVWNTTARFDLTPQARDGHLTLAVEGVNAGEGPNPAGLLASLWIAFADGSERHVTTSKAWKVAADPQEGWNKPGFDDSDWKDAAEVATVGSGPWGASPEGFVHAKQQRLPRAALVPSDPFQRALGRPDREQTLTRRNNEATLLQALTLTNGDFFSAAVTQGAQLWYSKHPEDPAKLAGELYRAALGRDLLPHERQLFASHFTKRDMTQEDVEDILWAVLLLPEFQLIL